MNVLVRNVVRRRIIIPSPIVRTNLGLSSFHKSRLALSDAKKNRPISPHVSIYKFPLPAMSSITHRFTGLGLTAGFLGFGLYSLVAGPASVPILVASIKLQPVLLALSKFLISFPLVYHYLSGLRHLFWDLTGQGLDSLHNINRLTVAMWVTSATIALALSLVSF
eukprot:TRINITY_DN914_c0_g1_i1.p1 TRINITY_DN914_c0_g1~~TRINITY_DN914_c0_g1_i1.p1  ORF type:complete len:165 (-),score=7.55 TRINITY_DN914_c0_g1_i1:27-521(-)